jgi:hypothetical protein
MIFNDTDSFAFLKEMRRKRQTKMRQGVSIVENNIGEGCSRSASVYLFPRRVTMMSFTTSSTWSSGILSISTRNCFIIELI